MKIAGVNASSCETTATDDYEKAEVAQETIYCIVTELNCSRSSSNCC